MSIAPKDDLAACRDHRDEAAVVSATPSGRGDGYEADDAAKAR
jgi:hypothetical protein